MNTTVIFFIDSEILIHIEMLYVPMKKNFFYKNLKINYQKVVVLIAEHLKVEIVIKMLKCNPIHYSCERIS